MKVTNCATMRLQVQAGPPKALYKGPESQFQDLPSGGPPWLPVPAVYDPYRGQAGLLRGVSGE